MQKVITVYDTTTSITDTNRKYNEVEPEIINKYLSEGYHIQAAIKRERGTTFILSNKETDKSPLLSQ
jgi:hypothetical protein